jgi:hypothetical protein
LDRPSAFGRLPAMPRPRFILPIDSIHSGLQYVSFVITHNGFTSPVHGGRKWRDCLTEQTRVPATSALRRRLECGLLLATALFVLASLPGSSHAEVPETTEAQATQEGIVQDPAAAHTRQAGGLPAIDAEAAEINETPGGDAVSKVEAAIPPESPPESSTDSALEPAKPASRAEWSKRVLDLEEQIGMGLSQGKTANALYHELAAELWTYQDEVYDALRNRSPDALDKRSKLAAMYTARVRLLEWVTPDLHRKLMGGGSAGMRELRREYANAKLDFFFQALAIPRGLERIVAGARESPLDDLWRLLELLFGIIAFRTWRRWARTGLPAAGQRILDIRPRTDVHLHVARLIWYVQRFRAPLEWLALLFFVSAIFEAGDLEEVSTLVWVILLWTLLTRFGLLLVDALAARSVDGPQDQNPHLRLRSLRVVAAWILLAGLGLDLTSRYVGEAAIHTWASRGFTLLLAPIALLLLHWWRKTIIARLENDASFSKTAQRMGKRKKGFGSYVNAATGGFYVLGASLLQLSIRVASRFDGGRKIVATLLRREVERDSHREHLAEEHISDELVLKLLAPDDTFLDGPYHEGIERLTELAKTGQGATVAVLAERGGGLSTFLRLLQDKIGDSMRIVDCPPSGPGRFAEALADEFGLDREADLLTELRPRLDAEGIRVIAVDNYHRLARPVMGGLLGMEQAAAIANGARGDIFWIVTLTRAAWPYINRMLGDRATLQEIIELPPWPEEQLEGLFDKRCRNAGIEPDYRRLVFPRQFDDGERATLEERNRYGFRRILWELSDGNPEVAMRLFADSLRELPTGRIVVRLPQPASSDRLSSSNRTTLLILKVLVETEMATLEDIQAAVQVPLHAVTNALAHCTQQKWVEEVYDHYQITWASYRTVKRVLIRRGLITR